MSDLSSFRRSRCLEDCAGETNPKCWDHGSQERLKPKGNTCKSPGQRATVIGEGPVRSASNDLGHLLAGQPVFGALGVTSMWSIAGEYEHSKSHSLSSRTAQFRGKPFRGVLGWLLSKGTPTRSFLAHPAGAPALFAQH